MQIPIPNIVHSILLTLESNGFEAYVVGGCVRDSLLHLVPNDWDISTNATPEQILSIFKTHSTFKPLTIGAKYGTISLYHIASKHTVEITTFRIDGAYLDCRHPNSVHFTPHLKEDLKRRDFSINALAYSPTLNRIYDYHNGIDDLQKRIISCIGDANMRFCEDGLRILRALRFQASLPFGFHIAPSTKEAILQHKYLLSQIAKERTQAELNKLILGDFIEEVFFEFYEVFGEIFRFCTPELIQRAEHTLCAMCKCIEASPKELCIRFGIFFSYITESMGFDHPSSLQFANDTLRGLKYSKAFINMILTLLKYPPINPSKIALKMLASHIGIEHLKLLVYFWEARYGLKQNLESMCHEIANECFCLQNLAINGNDIKYIADTLNAHITGKDIGIILHNLLDLVIKEQMPNHKTTLCRQAKHLLKHL